MTRHVSVMAREVIDMLALKKGDIVIDATLGDAGHAELLCGVIGESGTLFGVDQDEEAIMRASEFLSQYTTKKILVKGNFRELASLLPTQNESVQGILFDLGWSSPQMHERGRGFSFQRDEPLDMRMDVSQELTASIIINTYSEHELGRIIRMYGEDRRWSVIAESIVAKRRLSAIETTLQLVAVIGGRHSGGIHPATRVFQALRIAVNDELSAVQNGLEQAIELLSRNGRIVVISFHSLEDRIVKNIFRESEQLEVLTKRPLIASEEEVRENPRSRSAKMRVARKK